MMRSQSWRSALAATALMCFWLGTAVAELPEATKQALASSQFAYISSSRMDGSWSKPAEIWFFYHEGAVYVGTRPSTWRAKRIKWGRPRAKIAVGKPDGPVLIATGAFSTDKAVQQKLFEAYAKKYPDGWPKYEKQFRNGFKDGSEVMIKYTPVAD